MNDKVNSLDDIRRKQGIVNFKNAFEVQLAVQGKSMIRNINDRNLCFPSLYLLIPEIVAYDLVGELTLQNRIAIQICHTILGDCNQKDLDTLATDRKRKQILLWMFHTGIEMDGLDDRYDLVLDGIVALLILNHHDSTILEEVTNLIFDRNKRGRLIHDLVWSLYQSCDRSTNRLIGNYLNSNDPTCVDLACKLLHFIPSQHAVYNENTQNYHEAYQTWLDENEMFIYFTGESLQLTSNPTPYKINVEGKYLNKKVSPFDGKFLKPLSKFDKECLEPFRVLTKEKKKLLSTYSHRLYKKDVNLWRQWMRYDYHKKVETAIEKLEGVR